MCLEWFSTSSGFYIKGEVGLYRDDIGLMINLLNFQLESIYFF